ncbi:hypothetical protein LY76DRAFT_62923 [Colletotrichum caudatum]|nr:hypothetical protein LY76DRAFT_62923 [Colletotrichum caudatum]
MTANQCKHGPHRSLWPMIRLDSSCIHCLETHSIPPRAPHPPATARRRLALTSPASDREREREENEGQQRAVTSQVRQMSGWNSAAAVCTLPSTYLPTYLPSGPASQPASTLNSSLFNHLPTYSTYRV